MQMKVKHCHVAVADSLLLLFRWGSRGAGEVRGWHREAWGRGDSSIQITYLSAAFKQRNPFSQGMMHNSAEHT